MTVEHTSFFTSQQFSTNPPAFTPEHYKLQDEELKSPKFEVIVQQAVAHNKEVAKALKEGFSRVGSELNRSDNGFYPAWKIYETEYWDLLVESRRNAIKIAKHAKRFHDIICPFVQDPSKTQQEKVEALQAFQRIGEEASALSKETERRYQELRRNLREFSDTLNKWAEEQKGAGARMKEVAAKIEYLTEQECAVLDTGIRGIMGVFLQLPASGVARLRTFGLVAAALFATGCAAAYLIGGKGDEQKILEKDIAKIIRDLQVFASIWQEVKSDTDAILENLRYGKDLPIGVSTYLNENLSYYAHIGSAMIAFVNDTNV